MIHVVFLYITKALLFLIHKKLLQVKKKKKT